MSKRPKRPSDADAIVLMGIINSKSIQEIADEMKKSKNAIYHRIRSLEGTEGGVFKLQPMIVPGEKNAVKARKVSRVGIDWLLANGYVTKEQLIYQEVP